MLPTYKVTSAWESEIWKCRDIDPVGNYFGMSALTNAEGCRYSPAHTYFIIRQLHDTANPIPHSQINCV